jgi:DNA-binding response OmpR family regulator
MNNVKLVKLSSEFDEGIYNMLQEIEDGENGFSNPAYKLTKTEFELLKFFISNPNCIYTRKEIISNIWGKNNEVTERAIDTNITRLRKKLGEYGDYLTTRLGYGYGFQEQGNSGRRKASAERKVVPNRWI